MSRCLPPILACHLFSRTTTNSAGPPRKWDRHQNSEPRLFKWKVDPAVLEPAPFSRLPFQLSLRSDTPKRLNGGRANGGAMRASARHAFAFIQVFDRIAAPHCLSPTLTRRRLFHLQRCCHLPLGRSDAVAAGWGRRIHDATVVQGLSPTLSESGERQLSFISLSY